MRRHHLPVKYQVFWHLMQVGGPRALLTYRDLASVHFGNLPWATAARKSGIAGGWLHVVSGRPGAMPTVGRRVVRNSEVYSLTPAGIAECEAWWLADGEAFGAALAEQRARVEDEYEDVLQGMLRKQREEDADRQQRARALRRFQRTDSGKIVNLLRTFGRAMSAEEIRSAMSWPPTRPNKCTIAKGIAMGAYVRVSHGVYDLPERANVVPPSITVRLLMELEGGPMSVAQLADALHLDRLKMKYGVFRGIRDAGLIERLGDETWRLTAEGREKLRQARTKMDEMKEVRQRALKARYG